jgi:hypothetical protein
MDENTKFPFHPLVIYLVTELGYLPTFSAGTDGLPDPSNENIFSNVMYVLPFPLSPFCFSEQRFDLD